MTYNDTGVGVLGLFWKGKSSALAALTLSGVARERERKEKHDLPGLTGADPIDNKNKKTHLIYLGKSEKIKRENILKAIGNFLKSVKE